MFERSIKMDPSRNDKEREMTYNFSDSSSNEFAVEKNNVTNYPTLHNRSLTSYDDFRNPQNKEIFNDKIFATVRHINFSRLKTLNIYFKYLVIINCI